MGWIVDLMAVGSRPVGSWYSGFLTNQNPSDEVNGGLHRPALNKHPIMLKAGTQPMWEMHTLLEAQGMPAPHQNSKNKMPFFLRAAIK